MRLEVQFLRPANTQLEDLLGPKVLDDILDDVAAAILQHTRTRFLQQLDPNGNTWIPSQAGIARQRSGLGFTLFDTGKLFHSLELFPGGENERIIGTDVESAAGFPYGLALQEGTGVLPPRVFLGLGSDDFATAEAITRTRVQRALEQLGE